jgi:hypothetical protein
MSQIPTYVTAVPNGTEKVGLFWEGTTPISSIDFTFAKPLDQRQG